MNFGEKLDRLASERGWSLNHAIDKIGQYPKTVNRWKKGEGKPSPEDIAAVARVFDVDANWLIDNERGWDDQPNYTWATWLYVQAFQLVAKLGPEEAIRRMKISGTEGDNPSMITAPIS